VDGALDAAQQRRIVVYKKIDTSESIEPHWQASNNESPLLPASSSSMPNKSGSAVPARIRPANARCRKKSWQKSGQESFAHER
jgi:NADH:ubiquinone oxidoreductase subunit